LCLPGHNCSDNFAQKISQPSEDETEVVTDGGHDGVDLVAEAAFEEVAVEMSIGFAVADDGLYGGSSSKFLFDLAVDTALLP